MSHIILLYRSLSDSTDFDPADLDILRQSIRNNARDGITGFLVRADQQFFQVLHGARAAVDALFARLQDDPRHHDVELLLREAAPEQSPFDDWSMGYNLLLADTLGAGLDAGGARAPIPEHKARAICSRMIREAAAQGKFGAAFPFARQRGESFDAYSERLQNMAEPL